MYHFSYIARKRARFKSCCGEMVNIPYGTVLDAQEGVLQWKGKPLCMDTSQNAYEYFSQDDDGKGLERGKLVGAILAQLEVQDDNWQARWDRIWADPLLQRYKRPEHEDNWLWNQDFYDAPVEVLQYIASLIVESEQHKG